MFKIINRKLGITIHKSTYAWEKKNPFIVSKDDCRASFKNMKDAEKFAKKTMPHMYICPITFQPKVDPRTGMEYGVPIHSGDGRFKWKKGYGTPIYGK